MLPAVRAGGRASAWRVFAGDGGRRGGWRQAGADRLGGAPVPLREPGVPGGHLRRAGRGAERAVPAAQRPAAGHAGRVRAGTGRAGSGQAGRDTRHRRAPGHGAAADRRGGGAGGHGRAGGARGR